MGLPAHLVKTLPPGARVLMTRLAAPADAPPAEPPSPRGPHRGNKYRAKPTVYRGVRYDSKAEALRAEALDLDQAAGLIRWWQGKPGSFRLGCPENVYRPDFLVFGPDREWVEDVKGVWTAKFRRDVKLWRAYGPCELHIIKGRKVEIVAPGHEPERTP